MWISPPKNANFRVADSLKEQAMLPERCTLHFRHSRWMILAFAATG